MTPATRTTVVLPVKRLEQAKHRLSELLSPSERRALMAAMLADVLAVLGRIRAPHELLVVTADATAARAGREAGARVIDDTSDSGHSAAAALGVAAAAAAGADRVLLVPGDCPLLDGEEVQALLELPSAPSGRVVVVPDRAGTGTNALLLEPPGAIAPAFGPGSHHRHLALARAAGVTAQTRALASLLLDVDTPADFRALSSALEGSRGRAPLTAGLVARLMPAAAATR